MSSYYTSVEDGGRSRNGDRCSNRSAYIMRSRAKSVERGVFFKNTLTSKKWVVASVTSTEQCQCRRAGLQPSGARHAITGACRAVTGTTSGLQQAGQDILKELLRCLKLWFYRAMGRETGCIQELMCFGSHILSSVTVEGPTQLGNLGDTLGQSLSMDSASSVGLCWGLGRWSLKSVWNKKYLSPVHANYLSFLSKKLSRDTFVQELDTYQLVLDSIRVGKSTV